MRAAVQVKRAWYEVTGRGSGKPLAGLHHADVDQPYGKMITLCGVGISSAFLSSWLKKGQRYCTMCSRVSQREAASSEKA